MVFELLGLLIALPVSYLLAYWFKKTGYIKYQDELDKLFLLNWNGQPEDEMYAWFKVRSYINESQANSRKLRYIEKKIREVNKNHLYSKTRISIDGEILIAEEKLQKPSF